MDPAGKLKLAEVEIPTVRSAAAALARPAPLEVRASQSSVTLSNLGGGIGTINDLNSTSALSPALAISEAASFTRLAPLDLNGSKVIKNFSSDGGQIVELQIALFTGGAMKKSQNAEPAFPVSWGALRHLRSRPETKCPCLNYSNPVSPPLRLSSPALRTLARARSVMSIIEANNHPGADVIAFQNGANRDHRHTSRVVRSRFDTLTIKGPGAVKLSLDANLQSRIFSVTDSDSEKDSPLTVSGLTFRRGQQPAGRTTTGGRFILRSP
jgi:hypothetical protein